MTRFNLKSNLHTAINKLSSTVTKRQRNGNDSYRCATHALRMRYRCATLFLLLTLGIGQMWAASTVNGGYIYFDPSTSGWGTPTSVKYIISHDSYSCWYAMSNISNTKLYYISSASWGDAKYIAFTGNYGWTDCEGNSYDSRKEYGPSGSKRTAKNTYGVNSGSTYLFYASSSSNDASITTSSPAGYLSSGYSALNSTQTINTALSTDNGSSYSTANSKATISITSYEMTGNGTVTQRTPSISTSNSSNTVSAARTATTTLSRGTVATGYTFVGWYEGSTQKSTNASYTYYPTAATTITARFKANQYSITYKDQGDVAFSGVHGDGYPTTHTYGIATALVSPSKDGYTFGGWYTNSTCTTPAGSSLGATDYTSNITLYAKWTVEPGVTLSAASTTINVGQTVRLTATGSNAANITQYEFYEGSTKINTVTTSSTSATYDYTPTTTGSKTMKVVMTYNSGSNTVTSSNVVITLNTPAVGTLTEAGSTTEMWIGVNPTAALTFSATSSNVGSNASVSWSISDASSGTFSNTASSYSGASWTYTPTSTGAKTITVTMTVGGNNYTRTYSLTVYERWNIYVHDIQSWGQMKLYMWNGGGNNATYPGASCSNYNESDSWYTVTLDSKFNSGFLLSADGDATKTTDLAMNKSTYPSGSYWYVTLNSGGSLSSVSVSNPTLAAVTLVKAAENQLTLKGQITNCGGDGSSAADMKEVGFTIGSTDYEADCTDGVYFYKTITGLTANNSYSVTAYAENIHGTGTSTSSSHSTLAHTTHRIQVRSSAQPYIYAWTDNPACSTGEIKNGTYGTISAGVTMTSTGTTSALGTWYYYDLPIQYEKFLITQGSNSSQWDTNKTADQNAPNDDQCYWYWNASEKLSHGNQTFGTMACPILDPTLMIETTAGSGTYSYYTMTANDGKEEKTLSLAADAIYKFKVIYNSDYYTKSETVITSANATTGAFSVLDGSNNECKIATTTATDYKFSFNTSDKTVTVTYPSPAVPAMTGTLSLAASGTIYGSGAGTSGDPVLVGQGTALTITATHTSGPDAEAHIFYDFNNGGQKTAATGSSPKVYNIASANSKTSATAVNASVYREYGPTGYKVKGSAVDASALYYQTVYPITYTANSNTSITGTKPDYCKYGSSNTATFTAAPASGYLLDLDVTSGATLSNTGDDYTMYVGTGESLTAVTVTATAESPTLTPSSATPAINSSVTVTVSGVTSATYTYTVQLSGGDLITLATNTDATTASYTVPALGTYTFRVTATKNGHTATAECEVTVSAPTYYMRYPFDGSNWESKAFTYDAVSGEYYYTAEGSNYHTANTQANVWKYGDANYDSEAPLKTINNDAGVADGTKAVFHYNARNDRMWVTAATGNEYRIVWTGGGKTYYSNIVSADNEPVSFWTAGTGSDTQGTLKWQKSTDGGINWNDVPLGEITKPATAGVYTISTYTLQQTDPTLTAYTGDYYIFSDNSGYDISTQGAAMKMTYFDNLSAAEFYNHYWCSWVQSNEAAKNLYASVGNSINSNLAGVQADYILATDKYGVNVRYAYNPATNYFGRNLLAGAVGSGMDAQFLMLAGCTNFYQDDGTTPLTEKVFSDASNWIYTISVKAKVPDNSSTATYKLRTRFNGTYSYPLNADGSDAATILLNTGTTTASALPFNLTYDFKTNRLTAGWKPDPETPITEDITINADLVVMRTMNTVPSVISLNSNVTVGGLKSISTIIELPRDDIFNNDGTYKSKSAKLLWISVPYDCNISDLSGLDGYGTKWVIQRYAGDARAKLGWQTYFKTFWQNMTASQTMHANEGYILALNYTREDFSSGETALTKRLIIPSQSGTFSITNNTSTNVVLPELPCTVSGREKRDANWRAIGVPSYASATTITQGKDSTGADSFNWFYAWDNGTYTVTAVADGETPTYTFYPTMAYLVQFAGTLTWTTAANVPSSVRARTQQTGNSRYCLLLNDGDATRDRTYIDLRTDGSTGYTEGTDLLKVFDDVPQLYTLTESYELAANTLPDSVTSVRLCTNLPEDGDYVIRLAANRQLKNAVLEDRLLGTMTNLSAATDGYAFHGTEGRCEDRFVVRFAPQQPDVTTDADCLDGSALHATLLGNDILIEGGGNLTAGALTVGLFDATGKLLYSEAYHSGMTIPAPATAGIYLIRLGNDTQRIVVGR